MTRDSANRRKRTARDIAAAVALGAIDPNAEVLTDAEAAAAAAEAARTAAEMVAVDAARAIDAARASAPSTSEHGCGIPGCRHGATVAAGHVTQPDRQIVLGCGQCGAKVRLTHRALTRAGTVSDSHGPLAPVARRTYTRRGQ